MCHYISILAFVDIQRLTKCLWVVWSSSGRNVWHNVHSSVPPGYWTHRRVHGCFVNMSMVIVWEQIESYFSSNDYQDFHAVAMSAVRSHQFPEYSPIRDCQHQTDQTMTACQYGISVDLNAGDQSAIYGSFSQWQYFRNLSAVKNISVNEKQEISKAIAHCKEVNWSKTKIPKVSSLWNCDMICTKWSLPKNPESHLHTVEDRKISNE